MQRPTGVCHMWRRTKSSSAVGWGGQCRPCRGRPQGLGGHCARLGSPGAPGNWWQSSHRGIFGSHQSFGKHASSTPFCCKTPGPWGSLGWPRNPQPHPQSHEDREAGIGSTPQHCPQVPSRPQGQGPEVGTEAGPSPGAPALSGQRWGWAVVAAPPGKAHTR